MKQHTIERYEGIPTEPGHYILFSPDCSIPRVVELYWLDKDYDGVKHFKSFRIDFGDGFSIGMNKWNVDRAKCEFFKVLEKE